MLDRLQQLNVKVFFADNWETYENLFPKDLLIQTKVQTHSWSGIIFGIGIGVVGFAGKPVWFQKGYMIILTIFLFAYFHVNVA